jgi:membrane protease YdiL (CAAX protease family)
VGVLAPLWEEVLFRGFLLPSLAKLVTPWPAVTLTALLFAWMHSSSEAIVPLLLVALGCGVLLVRFDNLLPPIVLHGLYNLYVFANMAVQLHCGCGPVTASLSVSFGAAAVLLLAAAGVHWAGRNSSSGSSSSGSSSSSSGSGSSNSSVGGSSSSAGGSTPPPAVA